MAKRIFAALGSTYTPNALGSAATGSTYMALQPTGTATQIVDVDEVLVSGTATASTVGAFVLCQISTFATGPTALASPNSDGPLVQNATPTIQTSYITASTTNPTPSSSATAPKINLGINMFGGIVRWNAAPTQQWTCVGNAAPGGAILINATAGSGASGTANAHIIYEPY
jgi:hypothetical protein